MQPSPQSVLGYVIPSRRKPVTTSPTHSPTPAPRVADLPFVSIQICQFWTLHVSGAGQYMVFCVWLRPHAVMFSAVTHVGACQHSRCFLLPSSTPSCRVAGARVVCQLHNRGIWVVSLGATVSSAAMDTSGHVSMWTHVFISFGCTWERLVPGRVVT